MKIAGADGTALYAEAHGEGPAVVFCCGFCTTGENWRGQVAPLLAAGFRAVLWDYRGHGRSQAPRDPAAYSMERVVEDLGAVLDATSPAGPAVLVGLSFGGLASLHFARRYPERVRGLVLVGSGPGFKNPEAQAEWRATMERTADFIESRGLETFVSGRAGATSVGRRPELPAARAAAAAIAAQDPAGVALFGRRIAGPAAPILDALGAIGVPALVMVGAEDAPYLRAADVMAARLPRARKVVIPGAGHIVNIEEPEAFDAELLAFLKGLG